MSNCMGKRKVKKMASGGKPKTTKAMKELEEYNTLKRETKGFQQKKPGTPYHELPMKEKVKMLMKKDKKASGGSVKKMAKGGFPDLNKDGKVTKADILKGRGVGKAYGGKVKKMSKGGKLLGGPLKYGVAGMAAKLASKKLGKNAGFAAGLVPGILARKNSDDKEKSAMEAAKARVAAPKKAGMAKGGKVKGRRGDGICSRGRTKGRMV